MKTRGQTLRNFRRKHKGILDYFITSPLCLGYVSAWHSSFSTICPKYSVPNTHLSFTKHVTCLIFLAGLDCILLSLDNLYFFTFSPNIQILPIFEVLAQMSSLPLNLPDPPLARINCSLSSILPQHLVFSSGQALIPFCMHLLQTTESRSKVSAWHSRPPTETVIICPFLPLPPNCGHLKNTGLLKKKEHRLFILQ